MATLTPLTASEVITKSAAQRPSAAAMPARGPWAIPWESTNIMFGPGDKSNASTASENSHSILNDSNPGLLVESYQSPSGQGHKSITHLIALIKHDTPLARRFLTPNRRKGANQFSLCIVYRAGA